MPELNFIPWFAWIAIAGIVIGGIISVMKLRSERNDAMVKVLEQNTAVNAALVARLDGVDGRLAKLEKTLDDIPS
jgi:hypothetical protein